MPSNLGWTYREQVGSAAAGCTLLAYLAGRWPHSGAGEWAGRIERGEVHVDGTPVESGALLRAGQWIAWHRPPWDEPDVPLCYEIIHVDEAIVAAAKPSGLPTMPAGGFLAHTLLTLVRSTYPDARPMHRLGRHTSGLVLFARTKEAAASLAKAWREHAVEKQYRTLAAGEPAWDNVDIAAPIGPVPHPALGSVHAASATGKPAHSVVRVLERRGGSTLLAVRISTGRPHQIRIHLAYAGHPLVGDPLYGPGGVPVAGAGLPGDGGYLLHAERLRFIHPVSRAQMELVASAPERLRVHGG